MPVSQREYDIMRLQAQIKILKIVEDWRKQFLRGRMQDMAQQMGQQLQAPAGPPSGTGGVNPYA